VSALLGEPHRYGVLVLPVRRRARIKGLPPAYRTAGLKFPTSSGLCQDRLLTPREEDMAKFPPPGRRESRRRSATRPDPQQSQISKSQCSNAKAISSCHPDFRLVPVETGLMFGFVSKASGRSRRSKVGSCNTHAKRHSMGENMVGCVFPRLAQSQPR